MKNKKRSTILNNLDDTINTQPISGKEEQRQAQRMSRESILNSIGSMAQGGSGDRSPINAAYEQRQAAREQERWEDYVQQHAGVKRAQQIYARKLEQQQLQNAHRQSQYRRQGVIDRSQQMAAERPEQMARWLRMDADAYERKANDAQRSTRYDRFGRDTGYLGEDAGEYAAQQSLAKEYQSRADAARAQSREVSAYGEQYRRQQQEAARAEQIAEDPAAWMRWAQQQSRAARQRWESRGTDGAYNGATDGIGGGGAQTAADNAAYDEYQRQLKEADDIYRQAYAALREQEAAGQVPTQFSGDAPSARYRTVNGQSGEPQPRIIGSRAEGNAGTAAITGQRAEAYMSDEQRQTYNYLYATQGKGAAEEYYKLIEPELEQARTQGTQQEFTELSERAPAAMTLLSTLAAPTKIAAGLTSVGDALAGDEINPNSAFYTPVHAISAIRQTVPQVTNWTGDKQIFGQDADSYIYGVITSSLDSALNMALATGLGGIAGGAAGLTEEATNSLVANATSALMGAEMLPDTVMEEKAKGRTDEEATAIAIIRSLIEGVTEKYSIEYFLGDPTTFGKKLGKAFLAEGSEEVASNWLNNIVDVVSGDPENVLQQWRDRVDSGENGALALAEVVGGMLSEDAASFIAGGISGLGMGAVHEGIRRAGQDKQAYRLGSVGQADAQAVVDEALAINPDSKAAQRAKARLDAGKGVRSVQLGRIMAESDAAILPQEQALAEASKKYGKQAGAMQATYDGEQDVQRYDEAYHVAYEMGRAGANLKAAQTSMATGYLSQEQRQAAWEAGRDSVGAGSAADIANGRALLGGQIAAVQSISERDGKVYAEILQGTETKRVALEDLKMDAGTKMLAESAKQYGAAAPTIFEQYRKGQQLTQYLRSADMAVSVGMASPSASSKIVLENLKSGQLGRVMAAEQIEALYKAGQQAGKAQLRKTGMTRLGTGSFTLEDSAKGTKLDKRQRASLRFLRDLARVTGLDISVYKSTSGADGTLMGANGSYVGGRIRVDLNAGAIYEGKLEDASMLRTVSHELTHFMAETAETEFKELQSFLVEKLSAWEGHSIQDLVDEKLAVAKSHGRDISTEEALEEVVADGCEMMLRDSKAIRQLAEENRTLFEKVRDWMTRFFDALRKAFEGVEAVHPESIHMMENYAEELQKLWDDALTAAVKNAKESGQKNSARTGADVRLSVQDGRLTAESTEQERYELLKDVSIRLTSVNEDAVNGVRLEDYNTRKKSAVIPGFRALAKQLGILNVDLQNSEIGFPFQFSGKNLEKSLHHQLEYGGTYQDYIRMMSCFNDLVENAVPIEVHTDKKAGTVRENKNLKQTYVLTSAYRDESSIVPVQLEVKEFHDVGAKLYLDVVLTKIEAEVLGTTSASNAGGPLSLLSASAISLRQIFENVNPADGRFLKYVPDGFLNEAQKDAKAQALRQQEQEYAGYGTKFSDRDYLSAVESGDIETAQKMVEEAAKAAGYTINAYHGTTEQFNVFETPVIFFTDDYMNADGYGNGERVVDAYLRIQNPLVLDAEGAKWDALDTPYGSSTQEIVVNEAVRLEYDGVIFENINDSFLDDEEFGDVSTVYAVFHPEQVKSADPVTYDDGGSVIPLSERFNPRNRDIRFSMRTPVEETRDLIAVHNLTEENLVSSLDIGGLPSPSIAIIKAAQGHSKYGPISIVFDKSTIDPQADSRNKIYGSDAWTPTVPRVEYQVNSKMLSQIERELHRLAGDTSVAGGIFGNSSALRSMGIDDTSNLNRKQLAEKLASTDTVRAAYLADQGQMLEPMKMDKVWDKFGNDTLQKVIDRLGVDTLAEMEANLEVGESAENALGENAEVIRDVLRDYYRKRGEPMLRRMAVKKHWTAAEISEKRQTRIENSIANVSVFTLEDIVRHAWEMYQDGGNTKGEIDRLATSEALRSAVDNHAVEEWTAGKLDGLLGKAGVYNGKERYTPSGNSRSFAQLHYDYTLENIVRAMNGLQQARGEGIWGASAESFVAVGTPDYRSIDEVRADKGRLREATEEEYDALKAKLDPMIEEIITGVRNSNKAHSDNQFEEIDIIGSLLLDAAKGTKTKAAIRSVFRKNGYTISDALISKAQSLYSEAAKMPTKYFEAKPQRAVSFDEARAIIVPDNTSAALVQRLEQGGANVVSYKAGDEQARLEALNGLESVKFSDRDSSKQKSIKDQIRANAAALSEMKSVANIRADLRGMNIKEKRQWAENVLKASGYRVDRQAFGVIAFEPRHINEGLNYLSDDGEIAAFAALPQLLKRGKIINVHNNHKGRDFGTVTIAAPVEINGVRGNMAAVVKRTGKDHYHTHRILMPDGSAFEFLVQENTEPKPAGALSETDTHATPMDPVSENRIAQNDPTVKRQERDITITPAEILDEINLDAVKGTAAYDALRDYKNALTEREDIRQKLEEQRNLSQNGTGGEARKAKNRAGIYQTQFDRADTKVKQLRRNKALRQLVESEMTYVSGRQDAANQTGAVQGRYTDRFEQRLEQGYQINRIVQDKYDTMVESHGAIPQGENASRTVSVPQRTEKGNRVSQTVRTAMEAQATTDEGVRALKKAVVDGNFSYLPITDKAAGSKALQTIKDKGYQKALADWTVSMSKGHPGKNDVALGFQLYNQAVNSGDTKTAVQVLSDLASRVREGAQMVQAVRMLKKLSPDNQLYSVQLSLKALQEDVDGRYGKKAPKLKLNEALVNNLLEAENEAQKEAAQKAIYRDLASQFPHTFMDRWNSWRYLCMLGNARTHVRNILGNAGFVPVRRMKDAVALGIEAAYSKAKGGNVERSKGFVSPNSDLYKLAKADYENIADLITGGGKYNDAASGIESMKSAFGEKGVWKYLSKIADANSFALDAEDVWFSKPAYAQSLAGYLKANKITTEQFNADEAIRDKARAYAVKEAQRATYRDYNDFSNFIAKVGRTKRGGGTTAKAASTLMEGVLPFRRTPANILVRGVEYSPIGLAQGIYQATRGVKTGKYTASQAIDRISSGLTGTALVALGALLTAHGILTPPDDDDEKQAGFDKLRGAQSYALKIGKTYVTVDWLAPEALPVFVGSQLSKLFSGDSEGGLKALYSALATISEPMLEMSMLSSLQDVIENVSYADSKLMAILSTAATNYLTQAFPTLAGQIERITESERETTFATEDSPLTKDLQYILAKIMNKTPGEFQQIPYIDAWGRHEDTGTVLARAFNNLLNPAYLSYDKSEPFEDELQRLYDLGYNDLLPQRVKQSQKVEGETLTQEEYVAFAETKGKTQYEALKGIIDSSWYEDLSDAARGELLGMAYSYADGMARLEVNENADVSKWILETKAAVEDGGKLSEILRDRLDEDVIDFQTAYPQYADLGDNKIHGYLEYCEPAGVPLDTVYNAAQTCKDFEGEKDSDGKTISGSVKAQVVEYIQSLGLNRTQAKALWDALKGDWKDEDTPWA